MAPPPQRLLDNEDEDDKFPAQQLFILGLVHQIFSLAFTND